MDSACPFHIYLKKEWFDTIEKEKENQVKLADGSKVKVEGIGKVIIKLHDNRVNIFDKVSYVPKCKTI